ncbi:LysR family transcriptional regulator [Polymorphobacter sp.]|uniref:LysR family transcriptional regulator n=1 Tax=Polymorphobacter sp. TaxID=1909290 RepID=UPI003F6F3343
MEIWDFNLRHLRAMAMIARLGTMSAAAEAVNLTQPAITQALSTIEDRLGTALFERRHDGMSPTAVAATLLPYVDAALDLIASPAVTMSRFRAFLALADAGSYTGAAHAIGLSAPSLHRAVNDLELAMGRKLVKRQGKRVVLTAAGAPLARCFRLARVELEAGLAEVAALRGHETRRIAIGAMPLSRARVLPQAIGAFLRQHPGVGITIVEGSRAELVEPLRNGVIDMMIGAERDPLTEPDLRQQTLFRDGLVVMGRKGHPMLGHAALSDLAVFPWVIAARGAPLRTIWEQMFARAGLPVPPVRVESGSVMIIRQLLVGSDFLTLLSRDQVAVEIEAGWLAQVAALPDDLGRTIALTSRAAWRPSAIQSDFLAALSQAAPKN